MKYKRLGWPERPRRRSKLRRHATLPSLSLPRQASPAPDPRQVSGFKFSFLFCYAACDACPAPAGVLEPRWRGISCRRLAGETSGPLEGSVEERHVCPQRMRACNKQYLDRLVERFCIWGQRVIILGQCGVGGRHGHSRDPRPGLVPCFLGARIRFSFFFSCRVDHRLKN
jgi:hypothetical protein